MSRRTVVAVLAATLLALGVMGVAYSATSSTCTDVTSCLAEIQSAASRAQGFATTTTTGGATSTLATTTTQPTTSTSASSTSTSTAPNTTTTVPSGVCTVTISPTSSVGSSSTGGTVCLASGVYNQSVSLSHSGVTVQAALGATPIIDGTGLGGSAQTDLIHIGASNVTFGQGIEVRNYAGRAITMTGTGDRVTGVSVHDIQFNGILAAGANETVDHNTVYRTVLSNTSGAKGGSGWAEAINSFGATNVTVSDNFVHDNWGEGIDFIGSSGAVASGNTVINDYSVLIYVDGSTNVTIGPGNTLSSGTFTRSYGVWGVLIASEGGGAVGPVSIVGNHYVGTAPTGQAWSTWNVSPTVTASGNIFG